MAWFDSGSWLGRRGREVLLWIAEIRMPQASSASGLGTAHCHLGIKKERITKIGPVIDRIKETKEKVELLVRDANETVGAR